MAIEWPTYTIEDLEQFPNDGNRYELLNGMLLVTPAPSLAHQVIVSRLQVRLANAVEKHAHVAGPGAVTAGPTTQLEPDVLVFPSHFPLTSEWEDIREHWLAIEVLSRSSRMYDREFKRDAYFALGVREVWLVDWWREAVEVCVAPGPGRMVGDVIEWRAPSIDLVVSIDLAEIFEGLDVK